MAMAPIFDEAMERVFSRWTLLALAVEQGWGGRDSRAKRGQLMADVQDYLAAGSRKRRPPSHENQSDIDALATFIYGRLDELYNTEADDGSDEEVAGLCLRLFNTCRAGDPSFAQQFLQANPAAPADLSRSQGLDRIQYATDEDQLLDKMQGMDVEDSDDDGSGSGSGDEADNAMDQGEGEAPAAGGAFAAAAVAAPAPDPVAVERRAPEPVVDEDGFVSVQKGRRRPR